MQSLRSGAFGIALGLVVALCACADGPRGERVVHAERSPYQTLFVTDSDDRRCLRFGDPASTFIQSCRMHDDPARLAFHYTRAMTAVLLTWHPPARRVLLIGVGGGSIPTALAAVRPDVVIDAVDIDASVVSVAQRYFDLRPGPRLRLHVADGTAFVARARERGDAYDAVLLDAFDEHGVPPGLFREAFLRDVKAILAPHGVLLANTVEGPSHAGERQAASAVFGDFRTIRPAPWTNNRLLVAAAEASRLPDAETLFARLPEQREALARLGIDETWVRSLEVVAAPVAASRTALARWR